MPIPSIPTSLEFLPEDNGSLKKFGTMLNKLWQRLFVFLSPLFNSSSIYVPILTANTGTYTAASVTGSYIQLGKLVFLEVSVTITTVGTGTNPLVTLPVQASSRNGSQIIIGCETAINGKTFTAELGWGGSDQNHMLFRNYDGASPAASGVVLRACGFYEAA